MLTVYDYREAPKALKHSGREPPQVKPFEGLELYDGKLSRTVLKGGGAAMPLLYLVPVDPQESINYKKKENQKMV
ncbi:MAG: hypothetical protein KAS66_15105 [Candidatus Omnitrophica bacterium]|nr:hypothetical protein [Candidatus Omnitrophota bacterium]